MMRSICLFILCCFAVSLYGQYFQQGITYDISGKYNKVNHEITAIANVTYTNNAAEAIDTIYLHLWANAFSSKTNNYTEQAIKLGNTEYYFAEETRSGGYKSIEVKVDGNMYDLRYTESNQIGYVLLRKPLEPWTKVEISLDYELKMPFQFDRFGWTNEGVQLVHWYPSIAVYDHEGWHAMDYLMMGEHFPTLADYTVKMELPFKNVVSSGTIDGTSLTKNVTDFAIVGRDTGTKLQANIGDTQVTFLHNHNPIIAENGIEYLADAMEYMEKNVGPYPHPTLAIVENDQRGGMEYAGLVTLGAKSKDEFRYYLVHELYHQWFYGSIVTDQRRYPWFDEGFTTYYQQRYYEDRLNKDHYSTMIPHGLHGKGDATPVLQKIVEAQAHRRFDQPLCTHIHHSSVINYGLNAYETPARWISHMAAYIGRDVFDEAIRSFYNDWAGKHPQSSSMQSALESASGKSLDWFFTDVINNDWAVDYSIEKTKAGVNITNSSNTAAPYTLITKDSNGETSFQWHEGHTETKDISLDLATINSIVLGPEKGLIDRNRSNNYIGAKSFKLVPFFGIDKANVNELYAMPLLNFNTSDGLTLGAAFYNSTIAPKRWKYLIAPQYGFKSGRLIGQAWTSYDQYLDHPMYRKLFYKLGIKSFDDQYVSTASLDQPLRYFKIEPSISLHFRHEIDSHKYSKLTLNTIFLQNETITNGEGDTEYNGSNIFQLRYDLYDFYELSPTDLFLTLEYQPYTSFGGDSEHYLKLIGSYKKAWKYAPKKQISARLFGSGFLLNTRRESTSFDRRITRGSIALIHQGFNDYTYEETYYNRYNQGASLSNQISYQGGGFKTPLGSQYGIGQSNSFALAINLEADIPALPPAIPLGVFFDLGYYDAGNLNKTLYSGGLALNFGEGLFSVYIPLVNSTEISNLSDIEDIGFFKSISFKIDINRFNPWEIIEDYNY